MPPLTGDLFDDGREAVLRLPPDRGCVRKARQFVCDTIDPWGGAPPAVALITSELVTNAVEHGDGEIILRVRRDGARALVEVHDQSSERPEQRPVEPNRVGGNGMRIVDALASSWGVNEISGDGKIVWFEIPL